MVGWDSPNNKGVYKGAYTAQGNYVRPYSMLSGVGLQEAEITDVILTHPH